VKRAFAGLFLTAVVALALACTGGTDEPQATSTPRPIPAPVEFRQEPQGGATLVDPAFDALPGAKAYFGRLGGSVYRIEVPDNWNGRLVLYMHGFRESTSELKVDDPRIRGYLIRNGIAWGASSYSGGGSIPLFPGLAADETAALWDLFVQKFGRPERTYVTGESMGGGAVTISAERYPNRYDGALGLSSMAGNTPTEAFFGDFFVAGAFVAGITQADFDSTPVRELVETRILPALQDETSHDRFEAIVIDMTGGPRPLDNEGFREREMPNWEFIREFAGAAIEAGLFDNRETVYRLGPLSDVSSEEFNAAAIRVAAGDVPETINAGQEISGDIKMPLLTIHATGDMFVPISAQQILRHRAEAAGKGDLLVQRAVRAAEHFAFTNAEWVEGLEAIIAWVEEGAKPEGEDLLLDDLSEAGGRFTLAPRLGSPEAEAVTGAHQRINVVGTLTVDSEPVYGTLSRVIVRKDGLERRCDYISTRVPYGRYEIAVASDEEARGCGSPGAQLFFVISSGGKQFISQDVIGWPDDTRELKFDTTFSAGDPDGVGRRATFFTGSVLDSSGESLPAGTVIEAYIGEILCGVTSLPPVVMPSGDPETYVMMIAGPESVPGCNAGASISFRVDGQPTAENATNDLAGDQHLLDLTLS
jgi:pimeloyl-ACP methyl ester carboxylesterase